MKRFPSNSVGLVFTDPPWATPTRPNIGRPNGVDLVANHVEYTAAFDFDQLILEAERVLVPDGYALIWCGWHNVSHIIDTANEVFGQGANNVIARITPNPSPRVRGLREENGRKIGGGLVSSWDCIAVLHRKGSPTTRCSLFGYQDHRNVRFTEPDIAFIAANPRGASHPASKPIQLCRELITAYSLPGDIVLDPCCGGGNILKAAIMEGRVAAGCDSGTNSDNVPWADVARTCVAT